MNEFMMEAKKLADQNLTSNNGGPFGAVIVKDGNIIGRGSNRVLIDNDPTAHAEMIAIKDACKNINSYDLSGCSIYTSCYPCPMCLSAIIWANIDKVYYGNTKEDAEEIGFRDKTIYDVLSDLDNNSVISFECKDRDETKKTFSEYKNKTDKEIY